ncbi:MAG: UPF0262 family protein [Rickettsiales bacterium]
MTETIATITLDDKSILRRAPEIEHEKSVAITDLLRENKFEPSGVNAGPYDVFLSIQENRLHSRITSEKLKGSLEVQIAISPLKKIIKDYFIVCESYFEAVKSANPYKVQAIDMGRRGLHDEGAELLKQLLSGKIEVDFPTSRRLFTLICVLHIK